MQRQTRTRRLCVLWSIQVVGILLIGHGLTQTGHAYIAVSAERLTLCEVMLEFPTVVVLRLEKSDPIRGAYVFQVAETVQGNLPPAPVKLALLQDGKVPPRLSSLKPGDMVVSFMGSPDNRTLSLAAGGWFLTVPDQGWERFTQFRDDFSALFSGTPEQLATATRALALDGSAVVRVSPRGLSAESRMFVKYDAATPHRRIPARDPSRRAPLTSAEILVGLRASDPAARCEAVVELIEASKARGSEGAELFRALKDSNAEVRLAAAYGLGLVKGAPTEVVPALAAALKDEDRFVCATAARSLSAYDSEANAVLKQLAEALADRNYDHDFRPHRAAEAAETILKLAPETPYARQALSLLTSERMLNDERIDSEGTRTAAARALGRCGRAAASALPQLVKRLRDYLPQTRIAAAGAVLLIGGNEQDRAAADKVLLAEARQGDVGSRIRAIKVIAEVGRTELLNQLLPLSENEEAEIRKAVKAALVRR